MVGNPKMDPPNIKTSCWTQNKTSDPMGIGLGIDYVTLWEICIVLVLRVHKKPFLSLSCTSTSNCFK